MSTIVSAAIPDEIKFTDIGLCSALWCLVVYACGRIWWYDSFFQLNTRKIFHLFILLFSCCRLVGSIMLLFEPSGRIITTYTTLEYFLSRNAYISFGMAFLAVSIYLSSIVLAMSERIIFRMWLTFWCAFGFFESYIVITTSYIACEPEKYKADGLLYQVSLLLATALSLCAALAMLIVGPSIALRLRRSEKTALFTKKNRSKSQRKYRKASQTIILITSLTITLMLLRFSALVYTPVTHQHMPVLLYYMMGFWAPEVTLTCMYLFVMRKARRIPSIDPEESNPLQFQKYKKYCYDSTTDDSRSSGSEDPHYFLDPLVGGRGRGREREKGRGRGRGREGGGGGKYDFFEPLTSPSFGGDTRVLPFPVSVSMGTHKGTWKGAEEEENESYQNSIRAANMLTLVSEEAMCDCIPMYQPLFVGQAELSISAAFKGKKISPVVALYTQPLARDNPSVLNLKDIRNLKSQINQAKETTNDTTAPLFQAIMRGSETPHSPPSLSASSPPLPPPPSTIFSQIEAINLIRDALDKEGCDVTTTNQQGYNALHIACTCGSIPVLLFLLSCTRDKKLRRKSIFQRTNDNFLPLHFLCGRAFPEGSGGALLEEVLRALCLVEGGGEEEGEEEEEEEGERRGGGRGRGRGRGRGGGGGVLSLVNARTMFGETPLHKACEGKGDIAILKFLLAQGADLQAVTKLGHTPKDLARYNHLTEAYTLLEQEERKTNRYVAVVPDSVAGSFSESCSLTNKCVDPIIMNSYIARKDRDRTEVIFHHCNEFSFHKTLFVRGVRQDAQLYIGLHNISVDSDNLDLAELCGIADFSIADLVCSQDSTITIPLFQPKDKKMCGTISVQLEHIDSYKHFPSGITRGYIFPCKPPLPPPSSSSSSSSSSSITPLPSSLLSSLSSSFSPFSDTSSSKETVERKRRSRERGGGEGRGRGRGRGVGPKKLRFEGNNHHQPPHLPSSSSSSSPPPPPPSSPPPLHSPPPPSSPLPSSPPPSSPHLPLSISPHPPSPPSPPSPSNSFDTSFPIGSLDLILVPPITPSPSPPSPLSPDSNSPLPHPISPSLPLSPSPLPLPLPLPPSSSSPSSFSPPPPSSFPLPSPLSPSPSPLSSSPSFRDAPSNPCPQTPYRANPSPLPSPPPSSSSSSPSSPTPTPSPSPFPSRSPPLSLQASRPSSSSPSSPPPFSLASSSPGSSTPPNTPPPSSSSPLPSSSSSSSSSPSPPSPYVRIREELQEGEFSFALPALLLTLLRPHREMERDHLNRLAEKMEEYCSNAYQQFDYEATVLFQGQLKDMNAVSVEQELAFKLSTIAQKHGYHCERIKDSIQLYSNYNKSYHNLSFKPSTYKGDGCLAFIPTNLHHQKMKVYLRGEHRTVEKTKLQRLDGKVRKRVESMIDQEVQPQGEYHVTTFGAPAAHPLKFKGGGLWHLQNQFDEKLKAMEEAKRKEHHNHHNHHQHHQQIQQILFQEDTSEGESEREGWERRMRGEKEREKEKMRKVRGKVEAISALELHYRLVRRKDICFSQILPAVATCVHQIVILNRSKPEILTQYIKIGLLLHFESLLSTYQAELGMLADYEISIQRFVSKLVFRFVLDKSEGKNQELGLEWWGGEGETEEGGEREVFSELLGGERGDEDGVCKEFRFFSSRYDYNSLLVTLPVSPKFFKQMEPILKGKTISIIPTFFTQGINEQQSFANRLGGTTMQERINRDSVNILALYFQKFRSVTELKLEEEEEEKLGELFAELMKIVKMSRREKNIKILSLSADIARKMNGGRLTSCKSAKDRTSMAVTWEQARLLSTHHHLSGETVSDVLTVMRSAGVRRENAYKNIGKNKFAFNKLQLRMIPGIYRAPKGSGGAEVT